ncbi:hypothetical protein BGZ51_005102 [Haplosporangium sp. Z 767]|nr:hypothetical protein BGZ50_005665 [Haplosporangium sp. Z 11]KAF9181931.1 hypothetical protein BGZ51_005102 [Haplosporangium sp. Z 767]
MAAQDVQLVLQAHLNQASLATNPQDLAKHLDAFSRDWKQEPTTDHFDSAIGLLRETKRSLNGETVAIWWAGYLQNIILSDHIDTYSVELIQVLQKAADPLVELINDASGSVIKRALQACASIYPALFRICSQDTGSHVQLWNEYAIRIKQSVLGHLRSTNEGVILSLCKYLQTVIQTQSHSQLNSMPQDNEAPSLNRILHNHSYLNANVLQQESDSLLRDLLSVIHRPALSSTIVTAIINQTSALQRARPQFIPLILGTWISFIKPSPPPHFSPLQSKFIDKSIRIQLLAISKMQLQPPGAQAITEALSSYGIKFNGSGLSRSQQQQLLHPDKDNGDDSRRSSKRARSSNLDVDDNDLKRPRPESDTRGNNIPPLQAPVPPLPAPPSIPPGFGQSLLGQINITHLPVHHVVDIIFETLATHNVPHLFHSFLSTLPMMRLKEGPLPMPPPGVGPPPPGLVLPRPPPGMLLGMMPPPPGGVFPPPPLLPHHMIPPGGPPPIPEMKQEPKPEVKQEIKKEVNFSKLQLPRIPDDVRVNINVLPAKHTPTLLPSRPVVAKSDTVTLGTAPRQAEGDSSEKEVKQEIKMESEEVQRQLQQETFQVKPFEPSAERPAPESTLPTARKLLEEAFERILDSERLVTVPGTAGRKMLESAASSGQKPEQSNQEGEGEGAVVPFDQSQAAQQNASKVVTKADWMAIVARLLSRAFTKSSDGSGASMASTAVKERMVDYICKDFKQRRELALTWLHEEWYYDEMYRRQMGDMDDREPQYLWCLYRILDGITSGTTQLDAKDRGLTRFLLEAPELPDGAVDIIQKYCDDPARAQLGMACLRDVVNLRPPSRARALEILLGYTSHREKPLRTMAIVTARKWYLENMTVGPKVEEYALAQLESLKEFDVPKREETPAVPARVGEADESRMEGVQSTDTSSRTQTGITESLIKQEIKDEPMDSTRIKREETPLVPAELSGSTPVPSAAESMEQAIVKADEEIGCQLELYFSLCAKNHSLLEFIFSHYISFDPFVQRVIRQKILPLIKSIKSDSVKLLALIRDFPTGAEMLVLRIIFILTDGVHPSPGLVSAVQAAVVQHDLNARFLVPIVSGMSKAEVLASLPRIVGLLKGTERERRTVTDVFLKLLSGSGQNSGHTSVQALHVGGNRRNSSVATPLPPTTQGSQQLPSTPARGPVLSPSELLIELHAMEDVVGWKAACEAMDICFNHPEIYKSEIIAVVLQQLLDQPTIPSLFMRTVIQAITLYKNLVGFVNSMILARLVHKKVWTRPVLWKGFVRCAKMMQPTSSSVLASLPKPQLKDVLIMEPSLKESVDAYAKAKSSGRRVGGGAAKQVNLQNVVSHMSQPRSSETAEAGTGSAVPALMMGPSEQIKHEQSPQPDVNINTPVKIEPEDSRIDNRSD